MFTEPMHRYGSSLTWVQTRNRPSTMCMPITTTGVKNYTEVDKSNEVETMTMLGKELFLSRYMGTLDVTQIEVNKPPLLN